MPRLLIWTMKDIREVIEGCVNNKYDCIVYIEGVRGIGKTQVKGSKVLMKDGNWKNVEDINIDDEIISPQEDGTFTYAKVIKTHSRFEKEIYDVFEATRNRKLLYSCAGNHNIPFLRLSHPRKKENGIYNGKRLSKQILDLKEAKELSMMKSASNNSRICGFTTTAIDYSYKNCSINPYALGIWLGNGCFTKDLNITSNNPETINVIPYELMNIFNKKGTTAKMYRYSILGQFARELERLGLRNKNSSNKFIPQEAMLSSIQYRLELLAGLIDTDGYVMKSSTNHIEYTTKSEKLADDIRNLVFSLGGYSNIKKIRKKCQTGIYGNYFNVSIAFENPKIIPLKNKFKLERLGNSFKHNPRHIAIKVIKGNPNFVYGFELDKSATKSQWYITDNWMITHNSTLAYRLVSPLKVPMPFHPKRDIVFTREDVLKHISTKKGGIIWADELINVGYLRDFYIEEQKLLLKALNMFRDSTNVFVGCIPKFVELDKQLQRLCKIRITVVRRGIALIQTQLHNIYIPDGWDIRNNQKIESKWGMHRGKNPRYSQLTTIKGLVKFPDLSPHQRQEYEAIKEEKRNRIFGDYQDVTLLGNPEKIFYQNLLEQVKTEKITPSILETIATINNKKPNEIRRKLNLMLKEEGNKLRLKDYIIDKEKKLRRDKLGFVIQSSQQAFSIPEIVPLGLENKDEPMQEPAVEQPPKMSPHNKIKENSEGDDTAQNDIELNDKDELEQKQDILGFAE